MSFNAHVGGVETLKKTVESGCKYFITVLGAEFVEQALYQLERILISTAKTDADRKKAKNLQVMQMHSLHKSGSNYSATSQKAELAFSSRYAKDYAPIAYLGEIGCGDNAACMKGILKIVQSGIKNGHLNA